MHHIPVCMNKRLLPPAVVFTRVVNREFVEENHSVGVNSKVQRIVQLQIEKVSMQQEVDKNLDSFGQKKWI